MSVVARGVLATVHEVSHECARPTLRALAAKTANRPAEVPGALLKEVASVGHEREAVPEECYGLQRDGEHCQQTALQQKGGDEREEDAAQVHEARARAPGLAHPLQLRARAGQEHG